MQQHLNDEARMQYWQSGIADFDLQKPVALNQAHKDYLTFYKLEQAVQKSSGGYYAGFEDINGWRIFQQYFAHADATEVVFLVHGYTDHAGLFARIINYLVDTGRSVIIFDQAGHGLSSGERATIEDFDCYITLLNERFGFFQSALGKPLHLVAQSMGAAITMDWLLQDQYEPEQLGKLVLLAPMVRPLAWRQAVWSIRFLSMFTDSIPRSYSRNSEDESFTHFVRYLDPVQHDRLPAQWVKAMIDWVKRFEKKDGNDLALWVIQGDKDLTVDWQYNLKHIAHKFPNSHFRHIEGAGHHLAGESERLQKHLFAYMEEAFASGD